MIQFTGALEDKIQDGGNSLGGTSVVKKIEVVHKPDIDKVEWGEYDVRLRH